ncbi:probable E3 ubiquitin-protein ligase RHY1A isoform X2 [Abrus precatorius]|uniref:Probable E3 ubiquitin-protein ligase RHY1A isoform X2 n=1 Tax=Abrus precatorius TaxID=3816 RepID=A0A8B8K5N8_ABRPR|nr:probable E3 ubiquitin-protein ligase RHY1A isoform X2 [Abrus precatorius]
MAGMLPGVECARRRRFHQSGGYMDLPSLASHTSTRRSSFCLYASNHESRFSSLQRSNLYQAHPDENMLGAAREAKQRLDDKFRAQRMSENQSMRCVEGGRTSLAELQTEVYGSKKRGSRKLSWIKWSWKASEQEDCAVCLESFRVGETLINLPCAHRFHSNCLKPWLENNSHCPCCRTTILSL